MTVFDFLPRWTTPTIRGGALLFLSLGLFAGCGGPEAPPEYKRIGYVFGTVDVSPEEARQLTHINYAFANVTEEGRVVLEQEQDSVNLAQLRALKSENPNLKILLSIGGWVWSDYFSNAALTDSSRALFARTAVDLLDEHDLDGLDIDWEYPAQPGEDNVYRPEDEKNFTLLLRTVRRHLDEQAKQDGRSENESYLLTIAAGADTDFVEHTNMAAVHEPLDFVNLMTYDFHGEWSDHTGHLANLYPPAVPDTMQRSGAAAVELFLEAGVPPSKLVLGVPFYGRGWAGVEPQNDGLYQPYVESRGGFSYDTLANHLAEQPGFTRQWDAAARAATLWNADSSLLITYEIPRSLRSKAYFVRSRGLGGIMYWQHNGGDGTLLRTLHEHLP